jgi:hypothetical protein
MAPRVAKRLRGPAFELSHDLLDRLPMPLSNRVNMVVSDRARENVNMTLIARPRDPVRKALALARVEAHRGVLQSPFRFAAPLDVVWITCEGPTLFGLRRGAELVQFPRSDKRRP